MDMTAGQLSQDEVPGVKTGLERKTAAIADLIRERSNGAIRRALVVGCGSGREVVQLARSLGADAIGIDMNTQFDPWASRLVDLRYGDARRLEFPDCSFDLVYSFHALEHIRGHRLALAEMRRVLTDGGQYCIGTPNRSRLLGYIGSSASTLDKVRWNLSDLKARMRGRFRNELGAHAGFTKEELEAELGTVFATVHDLTSAYYRRLYAHHRRFIAALEASRLARYLFPAVYFFGTK